MQVMKLPIWAFLISQLIIGGLVGCNLPAVLPDQIPTASSPAQYETVAAILTGTAAVSTVTPSAGDYHNEYQYCRDHRGHHAGHLSLPQPIPTFQNLTPTLMCDLAGAGLPIDVTIQDDSHMKPGEQFVKIWRLVNAGACTWNRDYAVTWFSGDNLGVRKEELVNREVAPGDSIDLSIDMVAPEKPGVYQSNWKLRNAKGEFFGIGPGGGSPFWVRIQVEAVETSTPTTNPPTMTPTTAISTSGSADAECR